VRQKEAIVPKYVVIAIIAISVCPFCNLAAQGTLTITPQIPGQFLWDNVGTPTIRLGEPFYIDILWNYVNDSSMIGGSMTLEFTSPDIPTITKLGVSGALPAPYNNVVLKNGFEDISYWNFFGNPSDWPYAFYQDNFDGTLPDIFGHAFGSTTGLPANMGTVAFYEFHFQIDQAGTFCIDTVEEPNESFGWYFDDAIARPIDASQAGFPYCYPVAFEPLTSVTNLNDHGYGSLRYAMESANLLVGPDTILFLVSGTIPLQSPLPSLIDDNTWIDGQSAPSGARSIVLDGSDLTIGDGLIIEGSDCRVEALVIRNFPGNGIVVFGSPASGNRLSENLIYHNGGLGIDLNNDGVTINDDGDLDTGPNNLQNYATVDSVIMNPDSSFTLYGTSAPNSSNQIYLAHPEGDDVRPADPSGHGEAYQFIGSTIAGIDSTFEYLIAKTYRQFSVVTLLTIDTLENSSEFSSNIILIPSPLVVIAYSPVNLRIIDPDGFYIGRDAAGNLEQTLFPASYDDPQSDSVNIPRPIVGNYRIEVVAENGAPPGATYSIGVRIDGSVQSTVVFNADVPTTGMVDTATYRVEEEWHYMNGDANGSGVINILDATYIISYLFKGGPEPYPRESADAQCNGIVNILDATFIIQYLFKGGVSPCRIE